MKAKRLLIGMVAACVLTACGGGGDEGTTTTSGMAPSAAQGLRTGTVASVTLTNVNLENDQFWTFYQVAGLGYVGFMQGTQTVSGSGYNGTGNDFSTFAPAPGTLTVTGTFTPQGSASGTATSSVSGATNFTLTYDTLYDQAALLSDVAGSWNLTASGLATAVTVASDGALTGSNSACNLSGSVTPRASGKNVFNASVAFSGASCALAGQTFTGIALALRSGATTQLLVGLLNSGRTTGILVSGSR